MYFAPVLSGVMVCTGLKKSLKIEKLWDILIVPWEIYGKKSIESEC